MNRASIPIKFWVEIFSSIIYLINRLPSQNSIPYKTFFNKEPNYNMMKVLGCFYYPLTRPYNKHKLELRSQPCVFIGYGLHQKGYRCFQPFTNKLIISHNVQFIED
jgi:dolichol kinase